MSYNINYVQSGQGAPPAEPPAGAAPEPGMPPPYSALPYPPAPPPGYTPGPPAGAPMVPPGQAPPMVMPGQAPPMVMPGQAAPMAPPPAINMGPVYNPPVPLIQEVPRPMQDGQTIHITGSIKANPRRFHINLTLGSGLGESVNMALHINPRWDEGPVIVRNSYLKKSWGREERWGDHFPLVAGQNFECILLVQSDCYKVAFNGHHFCEYKHRHAKDEVSHLVIEGDVELTCVWFQQPAQVGGVMPGVNMPPMLPAGAENTFKVPYKQMIPGALNPGRMIYITGTPNGPSYNRFAINFGYEETFKKDIALHFNPRYKDGEVVVRNTMAGVNWGSEERDQPGFPFHPGKPFDMIVLVEQDQYKVAVNGQHFITYQHRLRNLADIKYLGISGDITLTSVRM